MDSATEFPKESPFDQFPKEWEPKVFEKDKEGKTLTFLVREKGAKNVVKISIFKSTSTWRVEVAWGAKFDKTYDNPQLNVPFGNVEFLIETIRKFFNIPCYNNENYYNPVDGHFE